MGRFPKYVLRRLQFRSSGMDEKIRQTMTIREQLRDMASECQWPRLWITAIVAGLTIAAAFTIYYLTR